MSGPVRRGPLPFVHDISQDAGRSKRERARSAVTAGEHWVGYGWFMSFGTVIPLLLFLGGYVVTVTSYGYTDNCRYLGGYQRVDIAGVQAWLATFGIVAAA